MQLPRTSFYISRCTLKAECVESLGSYQSWKPKRNFRGFQPYVFPPNRRGGCRDGGGGAVMWLNLIRTTVLDRFFGNICSRLYIVKNRLLAKDFICILGVV